jgi:hypothetical protein
MRDCRALALSFVAALLAAACQARTPSTPAARRPALPVVAGPLLQRAVGGGIDTSFLRDVARDLASDAFEGRGTGTPGARRAAAYIADRCRQIGFVPTAAGAYLHPLALNEQRIDSAGTTVRITGPGVDTTFVYFADFIPDVGTAATLRGFAGEMVYVGRAIDIVTEPGALPPLRGAVALMRGEFGVLGAAADTLRARGASGVLQVIEDPRRYRLYRKTRGPARLYDADSAVASSFIPPLPAVITGPRMTVTLSRPRTGVGSGGWNDAYLTGLALGLPKPQRLDGWRAEVRFQSQTRAVTAENVACLLPGRAGPDASRAVALIAHYDHLGIGVPDERGDSIYNGFSDNAVGVALTLAVGESFARGAAAAGGSPLRHSLLLLFPVGEEQGLLGADHLAARPAWPLARITAMLNLDANAPPARPRAWRIAGDDRGPLTALVDSAARRRAWDVSLAPASAASDYYAFHRRGVPAVFFVPSNGTYEGVSVFESDSMHASMTDRYHQPSDEWVPGFPLAGLERYGEFTREIVSAIDGARRQFR